MLGADAGARVWGAWRRHVGLGAWGAWKRRTATCGTGSGASEMLCGARADPRKNALTRANG